MQSYINIFTGLLNFYQMLFKSRIQIFFQSICYYEHNKYTTQCVTNTSTILYPKLTFANLNNTNPISAMKFSVTLFQLKIREHYVHSSGIVGCNNSKYCTNPNDCARIVNYCRRHKNNKLFMLVRYCCCQFLWKRENKPQQDWAISAGVVPWPHQRPM